jgi:hypothetical protein
MNILTAIIVLLILLIGIIIISKNNFTNTKKNFIIQSKNNGVEWCFCELKHIIEYAFRDKNIIYDDNTKTPDLILTAVFGDKNFNVPFIACSGEPFRPDSGYGTKKPICEINTFIPKENGIKSFYIPHMLWFTKGLKEKIKKRNSLENINSKKLDIVYISKNCSKLREDLFSSLKKLYSGDSQDSKDSEDSKLRSLGSCSKTHDHEISRDSFSENDKIYKDYKFVFCLENNDIDGYITEKILLGFKANSIPIYWGTSKIKEYFNEKSFFYVNDYLNNNKSMDDIAKIIKNLCDDDSETTGWKKYIKEPIFKNNVVPDIFNLVKTPITEYGKEIAEYIRNNYSK